MPSARQIIDYRNEAINLANVDSPSDNEMFPDTVQGCTLVIQDLANTVILLSQEVIDARLINLDETEE